MSVSGAAHPAGAKQTVSSSAQVDLVLPHRLLLCITASAKCVKYQRYPLSYLLTDSSVVCGVLPF